MFSRPIHIGLSPNTSREDYLAAGAMIFQPWKWRQGKAIDQVEQWFKNYFNVETLITFNAGRSALLAILTSLELPKGSEVLVQAFTCVAVPNSVSWAGLTPKYVDIDKSLNVDVSDAEKKVTSKTKALIVQHTFGIPADMEKIVEFCKKHDLILIEDCAHALGATYKGKLVGTFGDAAIFSFGRDKIVSSVFGGIALISSKFKVQSSKLSEYQSKLKFPSYIWILQQLLHPVISLFVLYTYDFFELGKFILFLAQKLHLMSFPVYESEKQGKRPHDFPKKFPNALAALVIIQLNKLSELNRQRREIASLYFKKLSEKFSLPDKASGSVYLRFNVLHPHADEVRFSAKKLGIILGNWYSNVVDPKHVDVEKVGYKWGSCPRAEKTARESVNLPTYPQLTAMQVKEIIQLLEHV